MEGRAGEGGGEEGLADGLVQEQRRVAMVRLDGVLNGGGEVG